MKTITLSLKVTLEEADTILKMLKLQEFTTTAPTDDDIPKEDTLPVSTLTPAVATPVTTKPTAGKVVKMPGFMRTQTQIDDYVKAEAERVDALDEEAEVKAQRKEEKNAAKALKEAEAKEKIEENKKKEKEVEAIRKPTKKVVVEKKAAKKPWAL